MKNALPPCKDKACGHAAAKHHLKGDGNCILRDCPCKGYKN